MLMLYFLLLPFNLQHIKFNSITNLIIKIHKKKVKKKKIKNLSKNKKIYNHIGNHKLKIDGI